MKRNSANALMLGICFSFFLAGNVAVASDNKTSTIGGEVTAGEFSMAVPEDLKIKVQLTNKEQILKLAPIHTTVKDYRGLEEGWQVTVKSSNYNDYKDSYTLIMNDKKINDRNSVVVNQKDQTMLKELQIMPELSVPAGAKAGSHIANLEWNLQPTLDSTVTE